MIKFCVKGLIKSYLKFDNPKGKTTVYKIRNILIQTHFGFYLKQSLIGKERS